MRALPATGRPSSPVLVESAVHPFTERLLSEGLAGGGDQLAAGEAGPCWWRPGRTSVPGSHRGPQEHCQEAVATSDWSVTTKKCHPAGVVLRRPPRHRAQNMWANTPESQGRIASQVIHEI